MNIVQMTTPEEWGWFQQLSVVPLCSDTVGFICKDGDEILGMVVFDHFTNKSCHGHLAFKGIRAMESGLLAHAVEYALGKGLNKVFGFIPADNTKTFALADQMGGVHECTISNYFDDGRDYVVYRFDAGIEQHWEGK